MDPITLATRQFAADAEEFWQETPQSLLLVWGYEDQQEDLLEALRLCAGRPDPLRPSIVFRAPFTRSATYFDALAEHIEGDYARLRLGAAAEGAELPALRVGEDTVPRGALERAALAMNRAARLLGERFAGVVVVLAPERVIDVGDWRDGVRLLAEMRWSHRVRVAVCATLGGPLSDDLDGGVLFDVSPDELMDFVPADGALGEPDASVGADAKLDALLVDAFAALDAGRPTDAVERYREARVLCETEGFTEQGVAVLMALGGAYRAAEVPALSVESYRTAGLKADALEAWPLACKAWLGVGAAHAARENYFGAIVGFREAVAAAKRAGDVPLRLDALRMMGTCLLHLGREDEAVRAWREAAELAAVAGAEEWRPGTFADVARDLVKLLVRHGLARPEPHAAGQGRRA